MILVFPQQRNKVIRILKSTSVLVLLNTAAVPAFSFLALHEIYDHLDLQHRQFFVKKYTQATSS